MCGGHGLCRPERLRRKRLRLASFAVVIIELQEPPWPPVPEHCGSWFLSGIAERSLAGEASELIGSRVPEMNGWGVAYESDVNRVDSCLIELVCAGVG